MGQKISAGKNGKTVERSPAIQALQLTALSVVGATWQQEWPHTSLCVALVELRFCRLGKQFHGTK
jgi:hypothetical protein